MIRNIPLHLDVNLALVHERVRHADGHHIVDVHAGVRVDDEGNPGRSAANREVELANFPLSSLLANQVT